MIGFPTNLVSPNKISFDKVVGMIGFERIVFKFTLLSFYLCIGLFEILSFIKKPFNSLFFLSCKMPISLLFTCKLGAFIYNKL